MKADPYDLALARAAEECGVEPRFWDIFRREHVASLETRRAILHSLGMPTDSAAAIDARIAEQKRATWHRVLPPSVVVSGPLSFHITVPARVAQEPVAVEIILESGTHLHILTPLGAAEERETFEEPWICAPVTVNHDVPLGYHKLRVRVGDVTANCLLIVAPKRAYIPQRLLDGGKSAGFAISLYGIRSNRNWGCGDFTDLHALSIWAARELCVSFLALNPLHALHNRRPYNTSPYLPNSIFFRNMLYLDIEAVSGFTTSGRAQKAFASPIVQNEIQQLRASHEVEYERVMALKTGFLKTLFLEFLHANRLDPTDEWRAFEAFNAEEGDLLERFATFCALDEHLHRADPNLWIWAHWPEPYRDPFSHATRQFAKQHWRSVLFYKYAAWQTSIQVAAAHEAALAAGLGIGLYHDLALATDRFGADLWAHREFFVPGCRVGSPPDDFSPSGQDWGFPPPNTLAHRKDGYQLFAESIRRSCRSGGALRIDHVMRFFRLYWIPDGMDATQGAYVRERAADLVRILALESVRNQVMIIGEDLGTVEPYIREMLAEFGILSYRLLYFERNDHGGYRLPREYPRQALVSSTTHDLPTLSGFWSGTDIEARRAAGLIDETSYRRQLEDRAREKERMASAFLACQLPLDQLHASAIAFLASTPSMLIAINQEDLTREQFQQNLPGTTSEYPNWGRKMLYSLEELESDETAIQATHAMRDQLRKYDRC